MAPPQQSTTSFRQAAAYAAEPKRMRLSTSARSTPATTTRASTGAPASMTNKGSVYKAQRGKAVTAAAVKAKSPTAHRRRGRKGKSVYRGVCVTREGKWRAVIYKERKQLYLGVYESEVDAAKAHDRAARFHFAENAVCNFESEQEADRQAALHKQRQLVEQQQLVEDHPHAHLHGGSFSVGREEFDDLEEYHRGLEEACTSEEDQCGADGDGEESGDAFGEECPRSSRSMSSTSISAGSASGDIKTTTNKPCKVREVTATSAAAAAPAPVAPSATTVVTRPAPSTVGGGGGNVHVQQRARCSSGMSSCESDSDFVGVTASALLEPPASEGMGFPYAEDLLGYEMQSWFRCEDEEDQSMLQNQHPFGGGGYPMEQQQSHHYQPSAMAAGANLGWGFGGVTPTYSDGLGRSSSGSMSSSLSCDDDYLPSALPPLMGMSAEP